MIDNHFDIETVPQNQPMIIGLLCEGDYRTPITPIRCIRHQIGYAKEVASDRFVTWRKFRIETDEGAEDRNQLEIPVEPHVPEGTNFQLKLVNGRGHRRTKVVRALLRYSCEKRSTKVELEKPGCV